MFRTFARRFLPNPFDWMVKKVARKGGKKILLAWNRGLGDIALGLFAMVERIREFIPDAEITFLIRENLRDGFSMLEGVKTIVAPQWVRGKKIDVKKTLTELGVDPKQFDLLIENPSPTDWVPWQRGKVVPKLKWDQKHDFLFKKFPELIGFSFVGVQVVAETNYGLWRNWSLTKWEELFIRQKNTKFLLFGFGNEPKVDHPNVIDLRGKTTLFELLSIIKHCCHALILPDSGILSFVYYLNESFPIRVISLWADPDHGILKQKVASPNPQLIHCPLIAEHRDLSKLSVDLVVKELALQKPLRACMKEEEIEKKPVKNVACLILAGGQGTRLGHVGPKGLFPIAGKTLFQWICDQVPSPELPLAIMTSPLNHDETVAYFKKNHNFGLDIHFFTQEVHPFLNENKEPLNIQGPKGNGSVFRSFLQSPLSDLFTQKGIDLLSVIYVENPLAKPFDEALISFARIEGADVVCKCIDRDKHDSSMGVLVERENRIEIVEYTELDPSENYPYAYSGQLVFDFSFFKRMGEIELPLHWVRKKIAIGANSIDVWKGEHFIFDVLPYAQKVRAVVADRKTCYAPLKSNKDILAVETILRSR